MTDDNFAEHPRSLGEERSGRTGNAADWSPRDALICVLRLIDSGEIKPNALTVMWGDVDGDVVDGSYINCAPNPFITQGMISRMLYRINRDSDG